MDPGAVRIASYGPYCRWPQASGIRLPQPRRACDNVTEKAPEAGRPGQGAGLQKIRFAASRGPAAMYFACTSGTPFGYF